MAYSASALYNSLGEWDEALGHARRLNELDFLERGVPQTVGVLIEAGRIDEAEQGLFERIEQSDLPPEAWDIAKATTSAALDAIRQYQRTGEPGTGGELYIRSRPLEGQYKWRLMAGQSDAAFDLLEQIIAEDRVSSFDAVSYSRRRFNRDPARAAAIRAAFAEKFAALDAEVGSR